MTARILARYHSLASPRRSGNHPHHYKVVRLGGCCADKSVKLLACLNRADYRISHHARPVARRFIDVILDDGPDAIGPFGKLVGQEIHVIIFVGFDEQIADVEGLNYEILYA